MKKSTNGMKRSGTIPKKRGSGPPVCAVTGRTCVSTASSAALDGLLFDPVNMLSERVSVHLRAGSSIS